MHKLNS